MSLRDNVGRGKQPYQVPHSREGVTEVEKQPWRMIKVTIQLTLGNEHGFTCASCLVFMSSKAEHTVSTAGSGRWKCWLERRASTTGKDHRWPLETPQPGSHSLESPCSPTDALILAQRNSFSISNLHTFKIINLSYFSHKLCISYVSNRKVQAMVTKDGMVSAGKQAFLFLTTLPASFKTCLDKGNTNILLASFAPASQTEFTRWRTIHSVLHTYNNDSSVTDPC